MSTEGWIFMVGFRVFDVGLLVLWLVWFFRLRDDDAGWNDDADDDDGGGPPLHPPEPSSGGGLGLVVPGTFRAGRRQRDHSRAPTPSRWRGGQPMIRPQPTRVRRPQPVPVRVR